MMRLRFNNEANGKLILIGVTIGIWLLIIILFKTYGYEQTWQLWRVPTEMPPFVDFRLIPGSAESFLKGYEPTVKNPYDPRERIFNYPVFWRIFFYSGVTQADTIWISTLMIVFFFIAVFIFPEKLTVSNAIWMLIVVFSPASMLLYERGNVDLIVFVLCVLIVLAENYSSLLAAGLLMFGIVVKVYPFFGISVLLKETRARFLLLSAVCLAMLVSYAYVSNKSMNASWNTTVRGTEMSYGTNVFFQRYEEQMLRYVNPALLKFGPIVLGVILILIVALAGMHDRQSPQATSERNLAAFRIGASIYVGTFLLGNNWDYRLAFLILVIPQLLQWTTSPNKRCRIVALIGMFTLLASCWHFVAWNSPFLAFHLDFKEYVFVFDELMNWILLMSLSCLLFASAPEWVKDLLGNPFAKKAMSTPT